MKLSFLSSATVDYDMLSHGLFLSLFLTWGTQSHNVFSVFIHIRMMHLFVFCCFEVLENTTERIADKKQITRYPKQ